MVKFVRRRWGKPRLYARDSTNVYFPFLARPVGGFGGGSGAT